MQAFHNDINIKHKYIERVNEHIKADNLIHGIGWEDGKGCAVDLGEKAREALKRIKE